MEKFGVECKKLMVEEMKERLQDSCALFITSFNTMGVSEQDELRRKLKEVNASLLVVKNRLAKLAFKQLNQEAIASLLQGPTGITFGSGDSLSVSKTLVNFSGKHENFKILGAYFDQQLLDPNSVKELASIPSREALLAQIVIGLKSPIQGLINALSGTIRNFVVVIDKIREKKG